MRLRNQIAVIAVALAATTSLVCGQVLNTSSAQPGGPIMGAPNTSSVQTGGPLEGTWNVQVSIIDCPTGNVIATFPSLVMFIAGGTMIESTSGIPPALKTPGEGIWRHTTGNSYVYRFKFFSFNTSNVFTGWTIAQAQISLDATGDSYTASGTTAFYDTSGNLIGTGCVTTVGTRFDF